MIADPAQKAGSAVCTPGLCARITLVRFCQVWRIEDILLRREALQHRTSVYFLPLPLELDGPGWRQWSRLPVERSFFGDSRSRSHRIIKVSYRDYSPHPGIQEGIPYLNQSLHRYLPPVSRAPSHLGWMVVYEHGDRRPLPAITHRLKYRKQDIPGFHYLGWWRGSP